MHKIASRQEQMVIKMQGNGVIW